MSIVLINKIRTAPFLRAAVEVQGDLDKFNGDSSTYPTTQFIGNTLPGASDRLRINFSIGSNQFVYDNTYLSKEELEALIPECGIYNEKKELIRVVNLHNDGDPFFCAEELELLIENGRGVFDDTKNPRTKLMIAFFMGDKYKYKVIGEEADELYSTQMYEIGFQEDVERFEEQKMLSKMDFSTELGQMERPALIVMMKIWGLKYTETTTDRMLKAKIWDRMDSIRERVNGLSKEEWISNFSKIKENKLKLWDLFLDARDGLVVAKNAKLQYEFEGMELGRYDHQVVDRLSQNPKIADRLIETIVSIKEAKADRSAINKGRLGKGKRVAEVAKSGDILPNGSE